MGCYYVLAGRNHVTNLH